MTDAVPTCGAAMVGPVRGGAGTITLPVAEVERALAARSLEVIGVDGGSTGGTAGESLTLAAAHPRRRHLRPASVPRILARMADAGPSRGLAGGRGLGAGVDRAGMDRRLARCTRVPAVAEVPARAL
jgi:hypothetical protein